MTIPQKVKPNEVACQERRCGDGAKNVHIEVPKDVNPTEPAMSHNPQQTSICLPTQVNRQEAADHSNK
jgi:hypothetical protein